MTRVQQASQPQTATPADPPALTAHLVVDGALRAIAYYERAFGARTEQVVQSPRGLVMHAGLVLPNGGTFYLMDHHPDMHSSFEPKGLGGTPVVIHVNVPDVDATWKQALAAGGEVVMELADQFWGDRYGMFRDPFGHVWSLATRKREVPPDELERTVRAMAG
jgi:PhnB protein